MNEVNSLFIQPASRKASSMISYDHILISYPGCILCLGAPYIQVDINHWISHYRPGSKFCVGRYIYIGIRTHTLHLCIYYIHIHRQDTQIYLHTPTRACTHSFIGKWPLHKPHVFRTPLRELQELRRHFRHEDIAFLWHGKQNKGHNGSMEP